LAIYILNLDHYSKLKAAQWYSLFAYIIPLSVKLSKVHHEHGILDAVYTCSSNYKKYNESVATLFAGVKVQPNHHCALHIPDQIRAWGPWPRVAEFTGERLIGFLQKIKTNSLIDKMNGTMMRRGCQLQRLMDKPVYQSMIQHEPTKGRSYDKKKIKLTDQMYGEIQNYL
ncbi:hypothetical protein VP01_10048g1, partial [Puccinia sorghi]